MAKTIFQSFAWFKRYKTLKSVAVGSVGSVGSLKLRKLSYSAKTRSAFGLARKKTHIKPGGFTTLITSLGLGKVLKNSFRCAVLSTKRVRYLVCVVYDSISWNRDVFGPADIIKVSVFLPRTRSVPTPFHNRAQGFSLVEESLRFDFSFQIPTFLRMHQLHSIDWNYLATNFEYCASVLKYLHG